MVDGEKKVHKVDCEVDTVAAATVMPLCLYKQICGDRALTPPTSKLRAYGNQIVKNYGSCTLTAKLFNVDQSIKFLISDAKGYLLLGQEDSYKLGYVSYPDLEPPQLTVEPTLHKCINKIQNFGGNEDENSAKRVEEHASHKMTPCAKPRKISRKTSRKVSKERGKLKLQR